MTKRVTGDTGDVLDKPDAAKYIGVSVRQLIRLTGKGEVKHLPKRRESEQTRYSRAALDEYLGHLPSVVSGSAEDVTPVTDVTPANGDNSQALARVTPESVIPVTLGTGGTPEFWMRFAAALDSMAAPVRVADKLTLSVAEAAQLTGFTKDALREAIGAGKLKAKIVKGRRGFTIKRADLDAYVKGL